jgi:hypothetical protein
MSNFMKIRPVGTELFHTDGRTDMTEIIVAFRDFRNAPKNATSHAFKYALPAVISVITFAATTDW